MRPEQETADRNWFHLYPPFREALERTVAAARARTGKNIRMIEGYRSLDRQRWLYAQGRTRPGKIVTYLKTPFWHGAGMAADVLPFGERGVPIWTPGEEFWRILWEEAAKRGLSHLGRWDPGHLQLTDRGMRKRALAWVKRGFRDGR